MRRTPSTDMPACSASFRNGTPSARAERSAALRRSVHSRTLSAAVLMSVTTSNPQCVDALALGQLAAVPKDRLRCLRAKVLGKAGDDLDVGAGQFVHVHNVDAPVSNVNKVDA